MGRRTSYSPGVQNGGFVAGPSTSRLPARARDATRLTAVQRHRVAFDLPSRFAPHAGLSQAQHHRVDSPRSGATARCKGRLCIVRGPFPGRAGKHRRPRRRARGSPPGIRGSAPSATAHAPDQPARRSQHGTADLPLGAGAPEVCLTTQLWPGGHRAENSRPSLSRSARSILVRQPPAKTKAIPIEPRRLARDQVIRGKVRSRLGRRATSGLAGRSWAIVFERWQPCIERHSSSTGLPRSAPTPPYGRRRRRLVPAGKRRPRGALGALFESSAIALAATSCSTGSRG